MNNVQRLPSVNFHLWEPCNMRCKFCFATFQDTKNTILPKGHLPREDALQVVQKLADFGFKKITFAGGEPCLCPWLGDLMKVAKDAGMTTMLVTNGSRLSDEFLHNNRDILDWITISIDSLEEDTNVQIGRAITGKTALSKEYYLSMTKRVKNYGYGLKINTVVNRYNFDENMIDFIKEVQPSRWKVLQVLPIEGENDKHIDKLKISEEEFKLFFAKHKELKSLVPENNDEMTGSYAMVGPAGRFFNNIGGTYKYSSPILDIGVDIAYEEMNYQMNKFEERGGVYDWVKA